MSASTATTTHAGTQEMRCMMTLLTPSRR
jgi:hypothetical protein